MGKQREINKLKKQRANILRKDYIFLSSKMQVKCWNRLIDLEYKLKQLTK